MWVTILINNFPSFSFLAFDSQLLILASPLTRKAQLRCLAMALPPDGGEVLPAPVWQNA